MATHWETVTMGSVRGPTAVESVPVMNGNRAVWNSQSSGAQQDRMVGEHTCAQAAERGAGADMTCEHSAWR